MEIKLPGCLLIQAAELVKNHCTMACSPGDLSVIVDTEHHQLTLYVDMTTEVLETEKYDEMRY